MQLTIEHLQTLVAKAREHLADNLICAGGAPADLSWGKQPKDIDLFVKPRPGDELIGDDFCDTPGMSQFRLQCQAFARKLGDSAVVNFLESGTCDSGGNMADVAEIHNAVIHVPGEATAENELPDWVALALPPIQIMALWVDPVDDVHEYDFFQRQVFVTPRGMFFSGNATDDLLNNQITYNKIPRDDPSFQRSVRRYVRLKEKYPHITFVGCEGHELFLSAEQLAAQHKDPA